MQDKLKPWVDDSTDDYEIRCCEKRVEGVYFEYVEEKWPICGARLAVFLGIDQTWNRFGGWMAERTGSRDALDP